MLDLERIVEAANIAATEGGRKVFAHKNDPQVLTKGNGEPFTQGDIESQLAILQVLDLHSLLTPDYGVIAEERTEGIEKLARPESRYQWLIDPLDGTKAYIAGDPMVTVCIALHDQEKKETLLGIVYDPFNNKTYVATSNTRATVNGVLLVPTETSDPKSARVLVDSTDGDMGVLNFIRFLPFKEAKRTLPGGSTAFKMCMVAEGTWDAYLFIKQGKPKPWDVMASGLIVRQSNGENLTLSGETLELNQHTRPVSMYITNGRLPMFKLTPQTNA